MLSRVYALFVGLLLIVMAIAGYRAPQFLGAEQLMGWVPTIWLLTGLVALAVGIFVRNITGLRWCAGIVGALYFVWGVIALFTTPGTPIINLLHVLSIVMTAIGALGLAVAFGPAYWVRETETYAPRAT
ncbi:MAG: hypothetical protein ACYDCO_06445 [Armatimonadota bacterium]